MHFKRMVGVDLKKNDVIVAIDSQRDAMNFGQLTQHLLNLKPGSEIVVTRTRPRQEGEVIVRWKVN